MGLRPAIRLPDMFILPLDGFSDVIWRSSASRVNAPQQEQDGMIKLMGAVALYMTEFVSSAIVTMSVPVLPGDRPVVIKPSTE